MDENEKTHHRPCLLRLSQIIAPDGPIPVGKSTWWSGVASGKFPQPIKLGPRITVWRAQDIEALIADGPANAKESN